MARDESSLVSALEEFVGGLLCLGRLEDLKRVAELDLSFSQARVLMAVGTAAEPLPIHVVAEQIGLSIAAAGRNVDQLVRLGAVSRQESPVDRRVKLVGLTEQGRSIVAAHVNARRTAMEHFVHRLPTDQRTALYAAIRGALDSGALVVEPLPSPVGSAPSNGDHA